VGQHHPPGLARLTAHGDDPHPARQRAQRHRGQRGDRQTGRHQRQLGLPVAHDVADVGALGQARPHPQLRLTGLGPTRHPGLAGQLTDLDRASGRERMGRPDTDHQLALGEGGQLQPGRLGVGRPERRQLGEHRQIQRAGAQGPGQRGGTALPHGDDDLPRQRRQRPGQQPGHRGGERAEPHRPRRPGRPGDLARGGVELVEHPTGPGQQPGPGRGQRDAVAATLEQRPPGDRLQPGHLPRDRRLGIAEHPGGGRERAGLGHLDEHPQAGRREVLSHAPMLWLVCASVAFRMAVVGLASIP
jgi:hypothetical protein